MKKFLLLLVGVLFALSAHATEWVLYVDIQNTNWVTAENPTPAVYFYCGEGSESVAYWAKKSGAHVYGTIYKFSFSWTDDKLTHGIFSTNGTYSSDKGEAHYDKVNGTDTYGELDIKASGLDDNWKLVNNRLYVLASTGTNAIASVTDNYSLTVSKDIYMVGQSIGWLSDNKDTKFTRTGEYTYEYVFTDKLFPKGTDGRFLILEGNSNYDNKWGGSSTISPNVEYTLTKGGDDVNPAELIENPTVLLDVTDSNNWKVTFKTTSDPTPTIETAYTIYFDAVRSGSAWANPHLTLGGVEVIGVADGSLIKYAFNAAAGDEIAFSNGSAEYTPALANNTVYYVDSEAIDFAAKSGYSYSPTHDFTYGVWGQINGGDWGATAMTYYPDGTWRTAPTKFKPYNKESSKNNFGIQKLKDGSQYKIGDDTTPGWIYCTSNSDYNMDLGVKSSASIEYGYNNGHNWTINTDIFKGDTEYVLVFDPEAMTIMFINPAVAATATAEPVAGDGVNTLKVSFDTASYYSGEATDFILSNGTFSAGAKVSDGTVSFENVPWSANYTLTPKGGAAIPVTISAPTITNAEYYESKLEWYLVPASENDLAHGMLSLQVTTTGSLYYYLPQAICKVDGQVVASNAFWSENGFTIQIPAFCELDNGELPADFSKAVEITYTPVFPFAVGNASTYGLRAYSGDVQTVLGTASKQSKTITNDNQAVSGVEGVMIEDEEAPVEYFNLQGQRVNGELAPGIYIRRQGATVTKVRF